MFLRILIYVTPHFEYSNFLYTYKKWRIILMILRVVGGNIYCTHTSDKIREWIGYGDIIWFNLGVIYNIFWHRASSHSLLKWLITQIGHKHIISHSSWQISIIARPMITSPHHCYFLLPIFCMWNLKYEKELQNDATNGHCYAIDPYS